MYLHKSIASVIIASNMAREGQIICFRRLETYDRFFKMLTKAHQA